ncbi:MAG: YkgJ family cysteine cluster protein [Candidatus Helarchaeales archaeon]
MRCGNCCQHPSDAGESQRYIPVYLDEISVLEELARKHDVDLDLKEDVMYPDFLNKQLIVISHALKFSNTCPFYDPEISGCIIYEQRPLTCKAYPVSIWREDGFRTLMHLENECHFIKAHHDDLLIKQFDELQEYFSEEFEHAKRLMIKGKSILYKIIQLEKANKIDVGFLSQKIDFFFDIDNAKKEFLSWPRVRISELKIED